MKCTVHRFDLKMTGDQGKVEQFLNSLGREVVAIGPSVGLDIFWAHRVGSILMVEKLD